MADFDKRRRFPRLDIAEEMHAYDQNGNLLGLISQIGGGGINLEAASESLAESLQLGSRLRIKIVESDSQNVHTVDVIVRNREGRNIGLQFAGELD